MKQNIFLLFCLVGFAACSTSPPPNREETQKEYEKEEAINQQKSVRRANLMSQLAALSSQIQELDAMIENQRNLISDYEEQKDTLASAQMMIDNATVRIKHLLKEKKALTDQRNSHQVELNKLAY